MRVVREEHGAGPATYALLHVQVRGGMRSWGRGGLTFSARLAESRTVELEAARLDRVERFRLEVRLGR